MDNDREVKKSVAKVFVSFEQYFELSTVEKRLDDYIPLSSRVDRTMQ